MRVLSPVIVVVVILLAMASTSRSGKNDGFCDSGRQTTSVLMMIMMMMGAHALVQSFPLGGAVVASWGTSCQRHTVAYGNYVNRNRPFLTGVAWAILPRYGPPIEPSSDANDGGIAEGQAEFDRSKPNSKHNNSGINAVDSSSLSASHHTANEFRDLIMRVLTTSDPMHIPSVLTKKMDLILSLSGQEGVEIVQTILAETIQEQGEEAGENVAQIIELILSFAEDFVQETNKMEDQNKKLLGTIILTMSDKTLSARDREQALDDILAQQKDQFTPGFVRHLDNECNRIQKAPTMTPESVRLLELLRVVQTRVLEELVQDLGEAAQVLGQLTGYTNAAERRAVLDAGLMIRGVDFAHEMADLTQQALVGFTNVPGGADPDLVRYVQEIDTRLVEFIQDQKEEEATFQ